MQRELFEKKLGIVGQRRNSHWFAMYARCLAEGRPVSLIRGKVRLNA